MWARVSECASECVTLREWTSANNASGKKKSLVASTQQYWVFGNMPAGTQFNDINYSQIHNNVVHWRNELKEFRWLCKENRCGNIGFMPQTDKNRIIFMIYRYFCCVIFCFSFLFVWPYYYFVQLSFGYVLTLSLSSLLLAIFLPFSTLALSLCARSLSLSLLFVLRGPAFFSIVVIIVVVRIFWFSLVFDSSLCVYHNNFRCFFLSTYK